MLFIAQTALELGFAYALVSLALFLSYRILDIADLTTDGGFCSRNGRFRILCRIRTPVPRDLCRYGSGAAAGFVTAFLQTRLGGSVNPCRNRDEHRFIYGEPDGDGMDFEHQSAEGRRPSLLCSRRPESAASGRSCF